MLVLLTFIEHLIKNYKQQIKTDLHDTRCFYTYKQNILLTVDSPCTSKNAFDQHNQMITHEGFFS